MSFLPNQTLAGQILSIVGLSFGPICTLLGRHYSRTLYFAQMLFLFSTLFPTTTDISFSVNLGYSWLSFMPSFTTNFCTAGDFSCNYGYLISPALCWVAGAIAILLLVKILACKFKSLQFLKVYTFYRGIFHWFLGPLVYFSTAKIISGMQLATYDKSFISALIVAGVFLLVAFAQIIAAKCAQRQEQNIWRKWIQFFCHLNVAAVMVCLALLQSSSNPTIVKYMLNIPLVLYAIIFVIKYKFAFKVLERISVVLQDAAIIVCYNIFASKYTYIISYNLDFFALLIVAALEMIFLFPKLVSFFRKDQDQSSSVNPEKDIKQKDLKEPRLSPTKKNKEFAEVDIMPNDSFQGLRSSSKVYAGGSSSNLPKQRSQLPKRK